MNATTTNAIRTARERADERERERVEEAARKLRRGEAPDAPPDILDAAENLAEYLEVEASEARLRDAAEPLLDEGRELLAEAAEDVEGTRREARAKVDAAAEAVARAEDAAGAHAALKRDLRALAHVAGVGVDPGDLPSPSTDSEIRFDEAVRTAGRRIERARREGGPDAAPGGMLDNVMNADDPDVAARRLDSLAERVGVKHMADLLRSDDAELVVRRRSHQSGVENARREIRRRAFRSGRLTLAGKTARGPSHYPEPVADVLRAAVQEPDAFVRGSRDLRAEIGEAADEVDPDDALRWARRRA